MSVINIRRSCVFAKGLLVAVALSALTACSEEKKVEAPDPVRPVKVVEIGGPEIGRSLVYSGSVRARTEMNLGFRVAGKITERLVDVGDRVEPGTILARLDAVDYQLSVRRADADLTSAQKQVEITGLARKRAETLAEKSVTSQSQLEQAQLAADQAQSQLQSAESALEEAQNQVAYTELKATQNGIVTTVSADVGQVVSAGTTVVAVAVDGEKEVQIAVPETDIAHFKPGKTVKASFWSARDLVLEGKVREVAGSADAQSRTFAVRVSLPADDRVLIGMTATIDAVEDNVVPTFGVPLAALAQKDGKPVVWIVERDKGEVSSRAVKVAGYGDSVARVSEGLAKGDLVVSAGTQFMRDGLKVKLPETVASRFGRTSSQSTASIQP
ncbi:hemolysin secretion protein D [Rhizobium wenxiniae]|jgi:RND family efflux transporter MFP subunit|uniref:RND family efflux transporter MFP subunit n=2 Tax=Rhizobium/Agrobacterium group TaxID=227290 RepID=A0A7W9Y437_9HYPH|nr:efflux RND transporter periplasmic adaptor subunit [Rhizobium wenxiniae]MBB6161642.1 RND family efflux transporter MFP subunit [Rhizobium wenxiniae]GGF90443.1 hemolysin secretion protein D [Rhizobium wenxiniae]